MRNHGFTLKRNTLLSRIGMVSCAAVLCVGLMPRATADEYDKKTLVTFSAPVEVPGGTILPAGTYVFKLLDASVSRNVVEILAKDEKTLYATTLSIPDYRLQPTDKTVITFDERPSGSPPALQAWFYPGDNFGQQFVYPHHRAAELAKRTHQSVLAMRDEAGNAISTASRSANDSDIKGMKNTEVMGVNPSGERVDMTDIVSAQPTN